MPTCQRLPNIHGDVLRWNVVLAVWCTGLWCQGQGSHVKLQLLLHQSHTSNSLWNSTGFFLGHSEINFWKLWQTVWHSCYNLSFFIIVGRRFGLCLVLGLQSSYLIWVYCICIRMRGGIYGKIWPESEGNPTGSGLLLPYIPTWVLIRTLSHS